MQGQTGKNHPMDTYVRYPVWSIQRGDCASQRACGNEVPKLGIAQRVFRNKLGRYHRHYVGRDCSDTAEQNHDDCR